MTGYRKVSYPSLVLLLLTSRICKGSFICPAGFLPHDGAAGCYMMPPAMGYSYVSGEQSCNSAGGHLVSISSQEENDAVQNDIGVAHPAWIGVRRSPATWSWVSGDPITWTNWPGAANQNQGWCLSVNTAGDWTAAVCTTAKEYLCEQDFLAYGCLTSTAVDGSPGNGCILDKTCCQGAYYISANCPGNYVCCYRNDLCGNMIATCPTGWAQVGSQCYLPVTTPGSFTAAHAYCVTQGGHMAVISDAAENSAIAAFDTSGGGMWVGLQSVDSTPLFVWSDGSPLIYTSWSPGKPVNGTSSYTDGCVTFDKTDGNWNTYSCTAYFGNAPCEAAPVIKSPANSGFSLVQRDSRPGAAAIVVGRSRLRSMLLCARECLATEACASYDVTSAGSKFVDCTYYRAIFLAANLISSPGVDYYQVRL